MSKAPIVYSIECLRGDEWLPLRDKQREPVTFRGPGAKTYAIAFADAARLWHSALAFRVKRGSEVVWKWTRS